MKVGFIFPGNAESREGCQARAQGVLGGLKSAVVKKGLAVQIADERTPFESRPLRDGTLYINFGAHAAR